MKPGSLTGAVLAGGASQRMGRDKALLLFRGTPLWRHQVALLRAAGAHPVGVGRRPDQAPLDGSEGVPLWFDAVADIGPLAGLQAALRACETDHLAVGATDMPYMTADWFTRLYASCRPDVGAIAQHPEGRFEPLAAIYPRVVLSVVEEAIRDSQHSLQALVRRLHQQGALVIVPLAEKDRSQFANWNTPADCEEPTAPA